MTDPQSLLEQEFLKILFKKGYRLPDEAQKSIHEVGCIVDFFYKPNICVFCDGSVHDHPDQKKKDENIRKNLRTLGYRVIIIRYDKDIEEQIKSYPEVFGVL
jgi:very-short-patch-repair endonuclease